MRLVDSLTDDELAKVNASLPWESYTHDAHGRRVGNPAGKHYPIPSPLVNQCRAEFVDLRGKTVLEMGPYEGAHTIGLVDAGAGVISIEGRMRNIMCAHTRAFLYDAARWVHWRRADVEFCELPDTDICFHSGVLYHLANPEEHLKMVCRRSKLGIFLDTHHTGTDPARERTEKLSASKDGLCQVSKWIPREEILSILKRHFKDVRVLSDREEPHGLRFTVVAKKKIGELK